MSASALWALALVFPAIFVFWTMSSTSSSPFTQSFPTLYNKRICLLIAHPDDEAMFFSPAVLALTKPELGNHLKILCLSSGDADGLGEVRKKELRKSATHLGLRKESDVFVVDDPSRFPDSMTTLWSESEISSLLASAFAPQLAKQNGSNTTTGRGTKDGPPEATIDVLLTFDQYGISNHPNHRSLYHGAVHFLRTLMKGKFGYSCPVALYTLATTNIVRKYLGVLDAPFTMLSGALEGVILTASASRGERKVVGREGCPNRLLFVSSISEWLTAQSAMVKGHQSQMVWFRWGWITIGRYMVVNDLKREGI